jgi:hypothetical protein
MEIICPLYLIVINIKNKKEITLSTCLNKKDNYYFKLLIDCVLHYYYLPACCCERIVRRQPYKCFSEIGGVEPTFIDVCIKFSHL